ncbi:methyl-accepting chemotaxis protein [Natrinema hispanicum]|uniref:Methyl-accepting chemotaxis protein n=1 Tax=Natrinema hispanicum TaxID=392421 RepID=A0A482YET5_9EURY|nr:globin-coupled sensor protein [Natrinema hispanicum]RZV08868.1 methyl-accepting chemotaxis protein [Natrinema hispanicum]
MGETPQFGSVGYSSNVDAGDLVDRIGLTEDEIEWRKQYIDFTDDDIERLRRYEETFNLRGDDVAEMFYEKIEDNPQVREILDRSPRSVEQLKWSQKMYLVTLATGDYDQGYFENRARIGKLHDMLEMPMKHYIGQYGVYYNLLLPIISERIQSDISEAIRAAIDRQAQRQDDDDESTGRLSSLLGRGGTDTDDDEAFETTIEELEDELSDRIDERIDELHSILKIINLDMQVAIDTYIDSYSSVEDLLEHQQHVTNRVSHSMQDISTAGEAIGQNVDDINRSVERQSEQTQLASSDMQEISVAIEQLATTTESILEGEGLLDRVETGEDHCEQLLESMEDATDAEAHAARELETLEETLDELDDIHDVIGEAAEKTKTLAVNANVEASRSRPDDSFTVVADEFQQLSETIQRQTKAADERVAALREQTDETRQAVDENHQRLERNLERSSAVYEAIDDVQESVTTFTDDVRELSSLVDDQASNTQEMVARLDAIDDEIQSISNDLERVTAAIEEQFSKVETVESVVTELSERGDQRRERYGIR